MPLYPVTAGGNITPSRILVTSTATANRVIQATGATVQPVGISQRGTRNTPYQSGTATLDDGFAAIAGENLTIFSNGDTCALELGGTVAIGAALMSDGSGRGITATTTNYTVAVASKAGVLGDLIEVQVLIGYTK